MDIKTIEDLHNFLEQVTSIQEKAARIANTLANLESKGEFNYFGPEDICFEDGEIYAYYEEKNGCHNEIVVHRRNIDVNFLIDDDFVKTAKKRIKEELAKKRAQKKLELEKKRKEQEKLRKAKEKDKEKKELAELKRLMEKYGR